MSDDVLSIVGGSVGAAAGVGVLGKYIWDSVRGRKEHLEQQHESRSEMKLDTLVDGQRRMELELRDMRNSIATQAGTVDQMKERVNGVAGDHGPRIKDLELWRASVEGKQRGRK